MYKSINIDAAVEHMQNIVDSIRCTLCDKVTGTRLRYACGHISCDDCAVVDVECSVCFTTVQSTSSAPVLDQPLTQCSENVVNLLNVFQNEFHIDVYRRLRLSEQLKVEKEVFPECIQAPVKYTNKRKSYKYSQKENKLSQLPGEDISPVWNRKMDQSNGNVERWLKKYVRKPFADLNSNDERLSIGATAIKKGPNNACIEIAHAQQSSRKRHFQTALSDNENHKLNNKNVAHSKKGPHKRIKNEDKSCNGSLKKSSATKNTVNNESGKVDGDPVIVLDDSQSVKVDKDLNAWLAVLESENNKKHNSASVISKISVQLEQEDDEKETNKNKLKLTTKVPFFLRGYLSEKCIDCNKINKNKLNSETVESTRDLSITIENKSFIAVIKVENSENQVKNSMQSVEVQTDISEFWQEKSEKENINNLNNGHKFLVEPTSFAYDLQSQDVFKDDKNVAQNLTSVDTNNINTCYNKTENVIIDESDSDEEVEASVSLEVIADIHRSCEEIDYGTLADVKNVAEHCKRPRRAARGYTPTSTDSSEKENYNPNRKRKPITSKKKPTKK